MIPSLKEQLEFILMDRKRQRMIMLLLLLLAIVIFTGTGFALKYNGKAYTGDGEELSTEFSSENPEEFYMTSQYADEYIIANGDAFELQPVDITSISISKEIDGQYQDVGDLDKVTFVDGDKVRLRVNYNLNIEALREKKTLIYQLPESIVIENEVAEHDFFDTKGVKIGRISVDKNGLAILKFDDEFLNRENIIKESYIEVDATLKKSENSIGDPVIYTGSGSVSIRIRKDSDLSITKSYDASSPVQATRYTLTARSSKGSDGPVTLKDSMGESSNTPDAKITELMVVKKTADGKEAILQGNQYKMNGGLNCNHFEITDLPELGPNEEYQVRYTVDPGKIKYDSNGYSAYLKNNASGGDAWNHPDSVISYRDISGPNAQKVFVQRGGENRDELVWRIVINNPSGSDLSGKQITDTLTKSPDYDSYFMEDSFTVNWNNTKEGLEVTKDEKGNPTGFVYTFPAGSTGSYYTIEYKTKVIGLKEGLTYTYKNTAKFGDQTVETVKEETIAEKDLSRNHGFVKKEFTSQRDTETGEKALKWRVEIKTADTNRYELVITDRVNDTVSTSGNLVPKTHYTKRDQIDSIVNQLRGLGYQVSYELYANRECTELAINENFIRGFILKVKKADGTTFEENVTIAYEYETFFKTEDLKAGEEWKARNEVTFETGSATAEYTFRKRQDIDKLVLTDTGNYLDKGKVQIKDGKLYYTLILRFEGQETERIELTDTLSSGMEIDRDSITAFYWNWNNQKNSDFNTAYTSKDSVLYNQESTFTYCYMPFVYSGKTYAPKEYIEFSQTDNVAKIWIADYPLAACDRPLIIQYAVKLTDPKWTSPESIIETKANSVSWLDRGGDSTLITVEKTADVIEKRGKLLDGKNNIIEYTVDINPAAIDVDPRTDTLSLTDDFKVYSKSGQEADVYAFLELGQVKLYTYDSYYEKDEYGNRIKDADDNYVLAKNPVVIDSSQYQVSYNQNTHNMTITLPDQLACVLRYNYRLDAQNYSDLSVDNAISLSGKTQASRSELSWKATAASAGADSFDVEVIKVDSLDYSKALKGVKFKLLRYKNNNWEQVPGGEQLVTDENGQISLTGLMALSENAFDFDTLYKLEETEAVMNYNKRDYYFYCKNKVDSNQLSIPWNLNRAEIIVLPKAGGIIYAPNEYKAITVDKIWVDDKGSSKAAPKDVSIEVELHQYEVTGYTVNLYGKLGDTVPIGSYKVAPGSKFAFSAYWGAGEQMELLVKERNSDGSFKEWKASQGNVDTGDIYPGDANSGNNWRVGHSFELTINGDTDLRMNTYTQYGFGNPDYDGSTEYKDLGLANLSNNQSARVTLSAANNWSYTWTELDTAKLYYVVETKGVKGWTPSYINNSGINSGTITIVNHEEPVYVLPSTGGVGTGVYTFGGLAVIAVGLVYGFFLRKRRERRLTSFKS